MARPKRKVPREGKAMVLSEKEPWRRSFPWGITRWL